jgi:hypothetical protein
VTETGVFPTANNSTAHAHNNFFIKFAIVANMLVAHITKRSISLNPSLDFTLVAHAVVTSLHHAAHCHHFGRVVCDMFETKSLIAIVTFSTVMVCLGGGAKTVSVAKIHCKNKIKLIRLFETNRRNASS